MAVLFVVFFLWCFSCCKCNTFLLGLVKTDEAPVIETVSWLSLQLPSQPIQMKPQFATMPFPQDVLVDSGVETKSVLINWSSVNVRYPKSHVSLNLLPLTSLGTEYMVYYNPPFDNYTSLMVLASADNTTDVNITFGIQGKVMFNGTQYNDGEDLSLKLEPYQTLTLNNLGAFTGTDITSSSPIAVFCGARSGSGILLSYEQLPPFDSDFLGKQYAVSVDDHPQQLQIISKSNKRTNITLNNGTVTHIGGNGTHSSVNVSLSKHESIYFNATDKVMVLLSTTDGDFVVVPPVKAYSQISVNTHNKDSSLKVMTRRNTEVYATSGNGRIENIRTENISGSDFCVRTYVMEEPAMHISSKKEFSVLVFDREVDPVSDDSCAIAEESICISTNRNISDVRCYDVYWSKIIIIVYGVVNIFLTLLVAVTVLGLCCRLSGSHHKQKKTRGVEQKPEKPEPKKDVKPEYAKVDKRKTYQGTQNANGSPYTSASVLASLHHTSGYEDIDKIRPMYGHADEPYSNNLEMKLPSLNVSPSFGKGDYELINDRNIRLSKSSGKTPPYVPDPMYADASPRRSLVKRKISDSVLQEKAKATFGLTDDFKYEEVEGRRASLGHVTIRNERALSDGAATSGSQPEVEEDEPVFLVANVEGRKPSLTVTRRNGRARSDGSAGSEYVPRGPIYSVVDKRRKKSNSTHVGADKSEKGVTVVHIINPGENIYSLAKM